MAEVNFVLKYCRHVLFCPRENVVKTKPVAKNKIKNMDLIDNLMPKMESQESEITRTNETMNIDIASLIRSIDRLNTARINFIK